MSDIYAGDSVEFSGVAVDDEGQPLDLTGALLEFTLAARTTETAIVTKANAAAGGDDDEILVEPGSAVTVFLSGTDTAGLRGSYLYDLVAKLADDTERTIFAGRVLFLPRMTGAVVAPTP